MIDCTCTIYAENETELSWPMGLSVVYEENQIHVGAVYVENETKLSCSIELSVVYD